MEAHAFTPLFPDTSPGKCGFMGLNYKREACRDNSWNFCQNLTQRTVTTMSADLCSICVKALASKNFQTSRDGQYHHPDLMSLVRSAETCALCRMFLENYSTEDKAAMMAAVDSGSYSKVVICAGDLELQPRLTEVLSPGAALRIEISTRDRCLRSQTSLILPPECEGAFLVSLEVRFRIHSIYELYNAY